MALSWTGDPLFRLTWSAIHEFEILEEVEAKALAFVKDFNRYSRMSGKPRYDFREREVKTSVGYRTMVLCCETHFQDQFIQRIGIFGLSMDRKRLVSFGIYGEDEHWPDWAVITGLEHIAKPRARINHATK